MYGHAVNNYWHKFDENFEPPKAAQNQSNSANNALDDQNTTQVSTSNKVVVAMMATTKNPAAYSEEYSLPVKLESQSWFADLVATHHLTPYANLLHNQKPYQGNNSVYVGNGQQFPIHVIGSLQFYSK